MSNRLDKREYLNELRRIKRNCLNKSDYKPEDDIAYLVTKFNLDWDLIWMRIKRILAL